MPAKKHKALNARVECVHIGSLNVTALDFRSPKVEIIENTRKWDAINYIKSWIGQTLRSEMTEPTVPQPL